MVKILKKQYSICEPPLIDKVMTFDKAMEILNNIKKCSVKDIVVSYETVQDVPTVIDIYADYRYSFYFTMKQQRKLEKFLRELNNGKAIKRNL